MKNVSLADLVVSAQAAAKKAFDAGEALEHVLVMVDEFKSSEFDKADFPTWQNAFNAQLEMLTHFSKQDSPATSAAKKTGAGS